MKESRNLTILERARNAVLVVVAFALAITVAGCGGNSSSTSNEQQNDSPTASSVKPASDASAVPTS